MVVIRLSVVVLRKRLSTISLQLTHVIVVTVVSSSVSSYNPIVSGNAEEVRTVATVWFTVRGRRAIVASCCTFWLLSQIKLAISESLIPEIVVNIERDCITFCS